MLKIKVIVFDDIFESNGYFFEIFPEMLKFFRKDAFPKIFVSPIIHTSDQSTSF